MTNNMTNKWKEYVKAGIVQFMACPEVMKGEGPIASTAASLLSDGFFEVIETGPVNDVIERRKVREAVEAKGAELAFACQPMQFGQKLNLSSLDEPERAQALYAIRKAIPQARALGAVGIALLSGPDPGPTNRAKATSALLDSLVSICREAGDLPVHLETFDRDVDKKCLIGPTDEAVALAKRVRSQVRNFGLMIDLSHLPLLRETSRQCLTAAKEVLTHIHVGNTVIDPKHPQYGDLHPRFGLEGSENGVEELAEFLSVLFEIGYLGKGVRRIVTVEVKPVPNETTDSLISATKEAWAEAWGKVRA